MELKTWVTLEAGRQARLAEHLTSVVRMFFPDKKIERAQVAAWTTEPRKPKGEAETAEERAAYGRPIPAYLAPAIEDYTKLHSRPRDIPGDGPVMRWDSCPKDWFLLWPELRTHRDAPIVAELEAQADT